MKKKMLECSKHGLTLHRCKRRYWHTKKSEHSDEYSEKCFKCINEGRDNQVTTTKKKAPKHVSMGH